MADNLFDVAVLGAGVGGYVSAVRSAQLGLNVAIIEQGSTLGGTCLNRGCIPAKAWLESAEMLYHARHAADFGVKIPGEASLDFGVMQDRRARVVEQLTGGVASLMKANKITVFSGKGVLASPTAINVTGDDGATTAVNAKHIILATGSYPRSLPGLELDGKQVISSDHIWDLQAPPKSVIVLGAGAVGVEFASFFNDVGSEVTVVEFLPALVPNEDKDVCTELERQFKGRGIRTLTGAKLLPDTLKKAADGITVEVELKDGRQQLAAEVLLVAVGRGANVTGIGLENTKVEVERNVIKVNEHFQTAEPNVYAVGDAIGGIMLAHVAHAEGDHAAEHIAGHHPQVLDYNRVPKTTYTRPQIGSLGLSEQQAKDAGYKVKTGRFSYAINGRAIIHGETRGFAKVVAEAETGEILGVHIIGHNASELVAEAAMARYLEGTVTDIGTSVHAHPTLTEILMEAALDADKRSIHFFRPR